MTYGTAYENRGGKADFFMKNKVTLVTGAAWGIGLTMARALHRQAPLLFYPISTSRPNRNS